MMRIREVLQSAGRRRGVLIAIATLCVVAGAGGLAAAAISSQASGAAQAAQAGQAAPSATAAGATDPMVMPDVSTAGFPSGAGQPGIFTDRCSYSHEAADDPILAPKDPGAAMHHNFYGNTTTAASSTAASLVGGATTCSTTADSSAYWTPVVYQNGTALTPGTALIYWRRPADDTESVQPIPVGLQLIAGNESATAPQSTKVTAWTCSNQTGTAKATATPHDCAAGADLRLIVIFPSCWDGHTLTGAGQTNVVYRTAAGCPGSHPVQIPQIVFHVNYPTSSATGLTVSMTPTMQGSTDTEHVDFINGWNQSILTGDVSACVATSTRCGPVTGAQATPQGPMNATRPKKAKH
jgi:Domain of unknown function (DUF1996)